MFGLKFKEPYCLKRYICTDVEGFHYSIYQRKLDPAKEIFFTGLGSIFICIIINTLWTINLNLWFAALGVMFIRLCTILEKGGENHTN